MEEGYDISFGPLHCIHVETHIHAYTCTLNRKEKQNERHCTEGQCLSVSVWLEALSPFIRWAPQGGKAGDMEKGTGFLEKF